MMVVNVIILVEHVFAYCVCLLSRYAFDCYNRLTDQHIVGEHVYYKGDTDVK